MGWSSRQVGGFTMMMVGIIVMTVVGMVTMFFFMTMDSVPEGEPLMTIFPTATPTNTTVEDPPPVTCNPTPQDALVFLPDHCAILIPPSSPSLSPSLYILTYYNMKRCPNHMCHPASCHGDRCCCQAIETSSLSYRCPNERGVLISNIVDKCGCTPCADMPVVFVGMVTDTDSTPIPHATILVDSSETYTANGEAIFGFAVPSSQEKVVVMVTATGYWSHSQTLSVMPGEVNVLEVTLLREVRLTLDPLLVDVLVNVFTMTLYRLPLNPALLEGGGVTTGSFIEVPGGMFPETMTLIARQVDIDNTASLQSLGMSFLISQEPTRRRRGVRGMKQRDRRVNSGGRGRRSEGVMDGMLFVVKVGILDIVGEEGERVEGNTTGLTVHAFIPVENCSMLPDLHLYLEGEGLQLAEEGEVSCDMEGGHAHIQASVPPTTPLPITYLLGVAEDGGETCYVTIRAFEPTSMNGFTEITTTVWLHTKDSGTLDMVNVMFGETKECVPIPCHGELSIQILDGLEYIPESYTVMLNDDIVITSDDVITQGEIYKDLSQCEDTALGETAKDFTYFQFLVLPRLPDTLPTSDDANLATPPFCSLRVGVNLTEGVVEVQVVAYSESSEGGSMVRVGRVGSEGGGEGVVGSGEGCVSCEETHFTCLQVSCDNQVTVTASSVSGGDETMVCVPMMVLGGGEEVKVEGWEVTLGGLGDKPSGFVIDSVGPDPSVAMEMCKMSSETDVWFLCLT